MVFYKILYFFLLGFVNMKKNHYLCRDNFMNTMKRIIFSLLLIIGCASMYAELNWNPLICRE